MSIAPIPPVVRSPQLVRDVTDASQNRSKQFIPTAYAVGKLFTGVTLPDGIDLNTYVTPGVSRLNTYRNGPPVTSPGYLVIHSINPDEDKSGIGYRYRQIYYPDSATETTPYTRVGRGTSSTAVTWSTWTTMGGNWVCEILNADKIGIVNYMYHSFNNWTLTLPDPKDYVPGTRIGLTQWIGEGSVVYETTSQVTTPDIDKNSKIIGGLQYIFQIVPDDKNVNHWSLDVDQDLSDWLNEMRAGLQANIDSLFERHKEDTARLEELVDTTKLNLETSIATEVANRKAADIALDTKLTNQITTETNNRIAADNNLNTTLTNKINQEITNRTNADNTLNTNLTNKINNEVSVLNRDKRRDMKTITNVTSVELTFNTATSSTTEKNLGRYDYRLMVTGTGGTIRLPTNVTMAGVSVVLMLQPGKTCTVVAGSVSETFTNSDTSAVLVIDMQTIQASSVVWTVLEVG